MITAFTCGLLLLALIVVGGIAWDERTRREEMEAALKYHLVEDALRKHPSLRGRVPEWFKEWSDE